MDRKLPISPADRHAGDGERLDLEGRTVEILRTPGHTPDSIYGSAIPEPTRLLELQTALRHIPVGSRRFERTEEDRRLFRFGQD